MLIIKTTVESVEEALKAAYAQELFEPVISGSGALFGVSCNKQCAYCTEFGHECNGGLTDDDAGLCTEFRMDDRWNKWAADLAAGKILKAEPLVAFTEGSL